MTDTKTILIAGGGIYGTVAAYLLAQAGHRVTLVEKNPLLCADATHLNCRKLHQGYRSIGLNTAVSPDEQQRRFTRFAKTFPWVVEPWGNHVYSLVGADETGIAAFDAFFADRPRVQPATIDPGYVPGAQRAYEVDEATFYSQLFTVRMQKLLPELGVELRLGTDIADVDLTGFDLTVNCLNTQSNRLRAKLGMPLATKTFVGYLIPLVKTRGWPYIPRTENVVLPDRIISLSHLLYTYPHLFSLYDSQQSRIVSYRADYPVAVEAPLPHGLIEIAKRHIDSLNHRCVIEDTLLVTGNAYEETDLSVTRDGGYIEVEPSDLVGSVEAAHRILSVI